MASAGAEVKGEMHKGDSLPRAAWLSLFVIADPPYGVAERTDRKAKGRGCLAECNDFPPVFGDNEPFDPSHLLRFPRLVLWGAQYFAERLPVSPSWLVWDKRDGLSPNDNADVEVAWTNLGGPARIYRHMWNGMVKASERDERRVHPTQKPVSLMSWIISTWGAAKRCGHQAIGIEIEERYCEVAAGRLQQGVLAL